MVSKLYLFFLIGIFMISCKKESTIAEITVLDGFGNPLGGITVVVLGDKNHDGGSQLPLDIVEEGITNSDGMVVFDFTEKIKPGQSGFAIVDILFSDEGGVILTDKMKIDQGKRNTMTFYYTP